MQAKPGSQTLKAFTLVELLITVSIILILAALSFAGFSKMRNRAYQIQSLKNMAQLMIANASYATDHNGKYVPWTGTDADGNGDPGATYWMWNWEFIKNYRGEPIVGHEGECPLSMLDGITTRAKKTGYDTLDSSYGYNIVNMPDAAKPGEGWMGKNAHPSFSVSRVTNPSQAACFITATDMRASDPEAWWTDPNAGKEGRTNSGTIAYRHSGKCLVVYYDGHVGAMSRADMKAVTPTGIDRKTLRFWNASYPY